MARTDADVVAVRGGGDLATGVVQKLHRAGFRVVVLETAAPTAIRRTVALCEAVYEGEARVEDLTACLVPGIEACGEVWARGGIPLLVDPDLACLPRLAPAGLIDAVLAKRNLGLRADMADIVIALGPGFAAPADAHAVVETMRGHDLGRVVFSGGAHPDTEPSDTAAKPSATWSGRGSALRPWAGRMSPRRSRGCCGDSSASAWASRKE